MEKKKIKLKLSGNFKKSINNIERAKTQGKNSVVIEKKSNKFHGKKPFSFNKSDTGIKNDDDLTNDSTPTFTVQNVELIKLSFTFSIILSLPTTAVIAYPFPKVFP